MDQRDPFDVIVIGGGMAGCSAAIAAARSGCHTLLVERLGFPGGCATAALVNPFMTHRTSTGTPLVAGLFEEIRTQVAGMGGLLVNSFDSECMKFALQEMVLRVRRGAEPSYGLRVSRPGQSGRYRCEVAPQVDHSRCLAAADSSTAAAMATRPRAWERAMKRATRTACHRRLLLCSTWAESICRRR